MTQDEIGWLTGFLDDTEDLFRKMVESGWLLFRKELRDPIREAWKATVQEFDRLRNEIMNADPDYQDRFKAAGLTDAPLILKIKAFRLAWNEFIQWGKEEFLEIVLEWINKILGSILSVLGGEAIKEFKEALEGAMNNNKGASFRQGDEQGNIDLTSNKDLAIEAAATAP